MKVKKVEGVQKNNNKQKVGRRMCCLSIDNSKTHVGKMHCDAKRGSKNRNKKIPGECEHKTNLATQRGDCKSFPFAGEYLAN